MCVQCVSVKYVRGVMCIICMRCVSGVYVCVQCVYPCVSVHGVCLPACLLPHKLLAGGGAEAAWTTGSCASWTLRLCPFPTNQMQISINSINGKCLQAIKMAQRLLVSGSKMDDQWPGGLRG